MTKISDLYNSTDYCFQPAVLECNIDVEAVMLYRNGRMPCWSTYHTAFISEVESLTTTRMMKFYHLDVLKTLSESVFAVFLMCDFGKVCHILL